MAIVAEDVKKIMAEEFLFYQVYMKANDAMRSASLRRRRSPPC